MKAMGVRNRCRVFEIPSQIRYIMAPPRMQLYIDYAARIYGVYLKYISPEDMHVYSIDEVFIDITHYTESMGMSAKELAQFLMGEVLREVGVRATCGIGTNLYLTKIALDITAKHADDFIGYLDEDLYRKTLWEHLPLTDFWRIGAATERRLAKYGIYTMGDIARMSECNEDFFYKLFGKDAELLIDHAYGRESCTMADIKSYITKSHSLTSGQVLPRDYSFSEGEIIVREMSQLMCLDLLDKGLVTRTVSVSVVYSATSGLTRTTGTATFEMETNSDTTIVPALLDAYRASAHDTPAIRGIQIVCMNVKKDTGLRQMSLFDGDGVFAGDGGDGFLSEGDTGSGAGSAGAGQANYSSETPEHRRLREEVLKIKHKYGKNAVIMGTDLEEGATAITRNQQIGGHKA